MADMPLATFQGLIIDVADAAVSGAYWSTMLGWDLEMRDDGGARLRDQTGRVQVWLDVVPEPKTAKNRVHVDVNAESVQRALDAGATVLAEFPRWTMMADPDGQEHCVFPRSEPFDKRAYELGWDCAEGPESHDLALWWRDVLGGAVVDDEDDQGAYSFIQDIPSCPWDAIDFAGVPEPKTVKNRVHVDVRTDDLTALLAHGATVLREKGDGGIGWTVLADPAGNEFCAFTDD